METLLSQEVFCNISCISRELKDPSLDELLMSLGVERVAAIENS